MLAEMRTQNVTNKAVVIASVAEKDQERSLFTTHIICLFLLVTFLSYANSTFLAYLYISFPHTHY